MIGISSRKIKHGKLVKVVLDFNDAINEVEISGDFFIYPETSLSIIESSLRGLDVREPNSCVKRKIDDIIRKNKMEVIGFSSSDLAEIIKEAML
ncbi:hypothetical protein ACFLQN_00235 [Candidatus Aenigmatarchaeota archaeon]